MTEEEWEVNVVSKGKVLKVLKTPSKRSQAAKRAQAKATEPPSMAAKPREEVRAPRAPPSPQAAPYSPEPMDDYDYPPADESFSESLPPTQVIPSQAPSQSSQPSKAASKAVSKTPVEVTKAPAEVTKAPSKTRLKAPSKARSKTASKAQPQPHASPVPSLPPTQVIPASALPPATFSLPVRQPYPAPGTAPLSSAPPAHPPTTGTTPHPGLRRRSSYHNRGKRLSTLGLDLDLHPDVLPQDFHKHLDANLSPQEKLTQMVVWLLKQQVRQLDLEAPRSDPDDQTAQLVTKAVLRELKTGLVEHRLQLGATKTRPTPRELATTQTKWVANPHNQRNYEMIAYYEAEVARLEAEIRDWEALASSRRDQAVRAVGALGATPVPAPHPVVPPEAQAALNRLRALEATARLQDLDAIVDELGQRCHEVDAIFNVVSDKIEHEIEPTIDRRLAAFVALTAPQMSDRQLMRLLCKLHAHRR